MDFDLIRRDIVSEVTSAPDTFTSWDKCMAKTYCKWPAITGIIIGSLILLSVLYCLGRCLCCGVSCAQMLCCCCRGGGGGKSKDRGGRFKDDYSQMPPTPYTGYQPALSPMAYQNVGPQFATFDASSNRKINDDSLPAMPSWDTAQTRRVEDLSELPSNHDDDVEMGHLPPQQQQPKLTTRGAYNQVPLGPSSPTYSNQSGYFAGAAPGQQNYNNSDLGAQRMSYNDQPLSPAPTYHTNVPNSGHYAAGAVNHNYDSNRSTYSPSVSTRYEPTDYNSTYHHRTISPVGQRPPSFNSGYDYSNAARDPRPPSLLQVGRKPVPGSLREV